MPTSTGAKLVECDFVAVDRLTTMTDYHSFDPVPRPPAVRPPPLACDCQFHVFGPPERYPVRPGAAYQMPTATIERALAMHRTLGIERGVIVQATTYGADHQVVLDALAAAGPDYRGCANAAVLIDRDDAYIERLHEAGVRGARFSRQSLGIALSAADAATRFRPARRTRLVRQGPARGRRHRGEHRGLRTAARCRYCWITWAGPIRRKGAADPSLKKVVELLGRGNFWVMLSLSEKISRTGEPWNDVVPIARRAGGCRAGSLRLGQRLAASGIAQADTQ